VEDFKLIEGSPTFRTTNSSLQLFNLASDPPESDDQAADMPDKVEELKNRINALKASMVKSVDKNPDPKADPKLFNNFWSPGWC
jgi:hypothetical protein